MWRGIRVRITALAALAVVVVLVATAGALLTIQRRLLTDSLDETLSAQAVDSARAFEIGPRTNLLAPRGDDDSIAQITTVDGVVVAATANLRRLPGARAATDRRRQQPAHSPALPR